MIQTQLKRYTIKLIANLFFILIVFILYLFPYLFIYHLPFLPWGTFFEGSIPNIVYYIFYAIIPAYLILWIVKKILNKNKKLFLILIFFGFVIGSIIIGIFESIFNPGNNHSEFSQFYVLPSLLSCLIISIYIVTKERKRINSKSIIT